MQASYHLPTGNSSALRDNAMAAFQTAGIQLMDDFLSPPALAVADV